VYDKLGLVGTVILPLGIRCQGEIIHRVTVSLLWIFANQATHRNSE